MTVGMGCHPPGTDEGEASVNRAAIHRARERELALLIERAGRGDQTALALLYDETSPLVYGFALRILRDQFAAEEVTIEVYAQVYRQAAGYDAGKGTPSAWLLMLTRSRAIDRLRAESQRKAREQPLEQVETLPCPAPNPEDCSADMQVRRIVQTALAALAPEQRQVIELAYYQGLSHTEVAAKLGQPLGTVKTRIRKGMMLLRDHLQPLLREVQP